MTRHELFAGIDVGSTTTKAVLIDRGGTIVGRFFQPTGPRPREAASALIGQLLARSGLPGDSIPLVATGYGRAQVTGARKTVTEITCHAVGARHLVPACRTVIDVGGQDSKAIRLEPTGTVADFAMNDKCAAGTGRFLEIMADRLGVPMQHLGTLAGKAARPAAVSSTCAVFAESEVVSLLADNVPQDEVAAGLHEAICLRIAALVNRVGITPVVAFTGGVALNPAMVAALSRRLGHALVVPPDPQLVGALGAAILALRSAVAIP